jgi:hypothetical protein
MSWDKVMYYKTSKLLLSLWMLHISSEKVLPTLSHSWLLILILIIILILILIIYLHILIR